MAILPPDPSFGCTYAPTAPPVPAIVPEIGPPPTVQQILQSIPIQLTIPPGASPDQIIYPYLKYELKTKYQWKQNTLQLPVATKPVTPPILQGDVTDSAGSNILNTYPTTLPKNLAPPSYGTGGTPVSGSGSTTSSSGITNRPSAKIIQVAAPTGKKFVTFQIVRQGAEGQLPDPTPKNANEVLDFVDVDVWAPIPTPDAQSFYWVASGIYVYSLVQPYWASDGFVGGSTPVDNTSLGTNWYPPSNYDAGVA